MLRLFQHARHGANEKEERQNMLGLFKRMLSKDAPPQAPVAVAPVARPTAPPAVARVAVPAHKPLARTQPAAPVTPVKPIPAPRPVAPPPATNTHVQVALTAIAAALPEAISHKVPANPEQFVPLPVDRILPQLANGQVVMTAAELLECAPDYFSALAGHESVEITLPLGDIIRQLSPEHFGRRDQRRVEVPAEVTPVFNGGANGVSISKPASSVQPSAAHRARPATAVPAPEAQAAPAPKIQMPAQALSALNARPSPVAVSTRPAVVATPKSAAPAAATPHLPPGMSRGPVTVQKKAPQAPKITGHLKVPLEAVSPDWIDEVRAQLADVDVAQSQILVPLELLEPAMRAGRVLFSWQEVAAWIQPPLAIPPTPKVGEMPVELPLKVIAPLFMMQHRGVAQKRVTVDEAIPNLFSGNDASAQIQTQLAPAPAVAAAPIAPTAPVAHAMSTVPAAPAPRVAPAIPFTAAPAVAAPVFHAAPATAMPEVSRPAAAAAPVTAAPQGIAAESIIGPATGRFGAKEIVANASKLPGVVGALLAMSDGLLVTSQAPPALKADTIAAFLPQMFGRMNQYTRELGLGALQRMALSVEGSDWQIFKAPNIYFAVLGKPGEALPLNLLAQVAAELSSQSN